MSNCNHEFVILAITENFSDVIGHWEIWIVNCVSCFHWFSKPFSHFVLVKFNNVFRVLMQSVVRHTVVCYKQWVISRNIWESEWQLLSFYCFRNALNFLLQPHCCLELFWQKSQLGRISQQMCDATFVASKTHATPLIFNGKAHFSILLEFYWKVIEF